MSIFGLTPTIGPERGKTFEADCMTTIRLHVVVGILRDDQGRIFITLRDESKHKGGLWEFPGGKVEQGEDSHEAIRRELREEISIEVVEIQHYMDIFHDYEDLNVYLEVFNVTKYHGRAEASEGQAQAWVSIDSVMRSDTEFRLPEANYPILQKLVSDAAHVDSD